MVSMSPQTPGDARPAAPDAEPPAFIRWVPMAVPLAALMLLLCAAVSLGNAE